MAAACSVETCFISSGCNRVPHSLHWGSHGVICFATGNFVALYEFDTTIETGYISKLLHGHKDKVHCVKWVEGHSKEKELVSGGADNDIIVWNGSGTDYQPSTVLKGHSSVVTALDAKYIPSKENGNRPRRLLIVSASCDSTVNIWQRKEYFTEINLIQSISFGNGFALDVALGFFKNFCNPLLAIGGDDCKVYLYVFQDGTFLKVQSLVGHEDWIRGLEFNQDDDGDLMLASCSQDCFIRLWRIQEEQSDGDDDALRLKGNVFSVKNSDLEVRYTITLESLLAGHEHWIYSVHWQSPILKDGHKAQPMCLLSASMDKTMIIWKLDPDTGVWLDQVRVGEVGGNTLGLYGCQMSPDGMSILGHGYQGALHLWSKIIDKEDPQSDEKWKPSVTIGGHFDGIQDLAWDPQGEFLLSVSSDQTARLFAPWKRKDHMTRWHEVARPQVHGYDMQCLAMIGRFQYVSGADEKVLRVFEAPLNFLENLSRISGCSISDEILEEKKQTLAEGASVPALGLSNKAVYAGDAAVQSDREIIHPSDQYTDIFFSSVSLSEPPTEEHLLQNTLWPETQKLYGHGYEIFCVAAHPMGTIIASACKASKAEHASIILWDTSTWRILCKLSSHSLTVTQVAFSHSGKFLLSVSRDRCWTVFEENSEKSQGDIYRRVAHTDKKSSIHSRIIWACSWSHDDKYFATASRDKKVIIWGQRSDGSQAPSFPCLGNFQCHSSPQDVGSPVTAVDFAPENFKNSYVLAVGLESGKVNIFSWTPQSASEWKYLCSVIQHHSLSVKRLCWRPLKEKKDKESSVSDLLLASCSADGSLVLHYVRMGS